MQNITTNKGIITYKGNDYEFISIEKVDDNSVFLSIKNETENTTYRLTLADTLVNEIIYNSVGEFIEIFEIL